MGDAITSSTVTASFNQAFGLCAACRDAATLIQASCSEVVPNSCICLAATIPYISTIEAAWGASNGVSGVGANGIFADFMPAARGRPARVISATLHLPVAIACAAWAT